MYTVPFKKTNQTTLTAASPLHLFVLLFPLLSSRRAIVKKKAVWVFVRPNKHPDLFLGLKEIALARCRLPVFPPRRFGAPLVFEGKSRSRIMWHGTEGYKGGPNRSVWKKYDIKAHCAREGAVGSCPMGSALRLSLGRVRILCGSL